MAAIGARDINVLVTVDWRREIIRLGITVVGLGGRNPLCMSGRRPSAEGWRVGIGRFG